MEALQLANGDKTTQKTMVIYVQTVCKRYNGGVAGFCRRQMPRINVDPAYAADRSIDLRGCLSWQQLVELADARGVTSLVNPDHVVTVVPQRSGAEYQRSQSVLVALEDDDD